MPLVEAEVIYDHKGHLVGHKGQDNFGHYGMGEQGNRFVGLGFGVSLNPTLIVFGNEPTELNVGISLQILEVILQWLTIEFYFPIDQTLIDIASIGKGAATGDVKI